MRLEDDIRSIKRWSIDMNRRETLAGAAAAAVLAQRAEAGESTADLANRMARANAALMKGDARTYAGLMNHTSDFTLMQPFGGKVVHGFDRSPEHLAKLGGFFRNGDFEQEVVQSISSGDVAVLVLIERQTVEVGGLPAQNWPLRVTLVFRREDGEWRLAHRHADPLVHGVSVPQAAALARGEQAAQRGGAIHHMSFGARDPERVAQVLAELTGATAVRAPAPPFPAGAWFVVAGDDRGSLIEILPADAVFDPDARLGFRQRPAAYEPVAAHVLLSASVSREDIHAAAKREGWRAQDVETGLFRIVKVWIDGCTLVEFFAKGDAGRYVDAFGAEGLPSLDGKLRKLEADLASALKGKPKPQR
jgi:ketosteroid isomerase-like protein